MGVAESTCDRPNTFGVHAYALRPLGGESQSAIFGMGMVGEPYKVSYALPHPLYDGLFEWFKDASQVRWLQHHRRYAGRDNRNAAA